MLGFSPYAGDLMGLPTDENHLVFRWCNEDCKILFSCAKRGTALSCHFAADKKGLRLVKKAIDEWCKFAFRLTGCQKIVAFIDKESVKRTVEKCGFTPVLCIDRNKTIYERLI